MTEELKQKAEANYKKHSEKLDKLWNGALYSEGALFGYNEAKKGFKEEIEDWKACHEHQLELMKGANTNIEQKKKQLTEKDKQIEELEPE